MHCAGSAISKGNVEIVIDRDSASDEFTVIYIRVNYGIISDMKNESTKLAPTIWRTVRAAMNPIRLNMLKTIFESSGRDFSVSDIARMFEIDQPIATIYLRQLNSRGLLGVTRGRIKVFYNANQDRSLPDSIAMQETLRECLKGELTEERETELLTILKAFAHFNRLAMITRLAEGPATISQLMDAVGGCVKSVYHHLRILYSADLIDGESAADGRTVFHLRSASHPLARTLLKITLRNQHRFAKYWNAPIGDEHDSDTVHVLRKIRKAENLHGYAPWRERKPFKPKSRPFKRSA